MADTNEKWRYSFTYTTNRTGTQYTCGSPDGFGSKEAAGRAARKHAVAVGAEVASIICRKR
jgi:hypothetical protein